MFAIVGIVHHACSFDTPGLEAAGGRLMLVSVHGGLC